MYGFNVIRSVRIVFWSIGFSVCNSPDLLWLFFDTVLACWLWSTGLHLYCFQLESVPLARTWECRTLLSIALSPQSRGYRCGCGWSLPVCVILLLTSAFTSRVTNDSMITEYRVFEFRSSTTHQFINAWLNGSDRREMALIVQAMMKLCDYARSRATHVDVHA